MINEVKIVSKEEVQTLVVPTEDYGIDFGALKKYCKENGIPYSNISDELVFKFRKKVAEANKNISNKVNKIISRESLSSIAISKKSNFKQQEYIAIHRHNEHYVASNKVISHKLPPHGHI